jgi:tRNA(fMet)-specific endonuclease VapC
MILLDTDYLTLLQRGSPAAAIIEHRIAREQEIPATTIVSYEEQTRGWLSQISGNTPMADQIEIYRRLGQQLDFYSKLRVVPFEETAAVEYQRLKKLKIRIGTMDLKIAAIALANEATLWSRNLRHFARVPKLKLLDVTQF